MIMLTKLIGGKSYFIMGFLMVKVHTKIVFKIWVLRKHFKDLNKAYENVK